MLDRLNRLLCLVLIIRGGLVMKCHEAYIRATSARQERETFQLPRSYTTSWHQAAPTQEESRCHGMLGRHQVALDITGCILPSMTRHHASGVTLGITWFKLLVVGLGEHGYGMMWDDMGI